MARCYSGRVTIRQPPRHHAELPKIWLISDARNDAVLERVLHRLPTGSGLVFRHYHLHPAKRRVRFDSLARLAKSRGHLLALSGTARQAREWGAGAVYGPPGRMAGAGSVLRLATVHSMREMAGARRAGVDAIFVSPVFPTRSHPVGASLGAVRALLLARQAACPVFLLGGMDARRFQPLSRAPQIDGWAAIDGLSTTRPAIAHRLMRR